MDACDVLIVGGGPAGSTCAWRLRRAGLDVIGRRRGAVSARQGLRRLDHAAGRRRRCGSIRRTTPRSRTFQPITGFRVGLIGGDRTQTTVAYDRPVELRHPPLRVRPLPAARAPARASSSARRSPASARRMTAGSSTTRSARRCWSAPAASTCPVARLLNGEPLRGRPLVVAREARVAAERGRPRVDRRRARRARAVLLPRPAGLRLVRAEG